MIDFERRILYFGAGDIAVGVEVLNEKITFCQIKPIQKIGDYIDEGNNIFIGNEIKIKIDNLDEYRQLYKYLKKVIESQGKFVFSFKGITFDFSTYSECSVRVVIKKLEYASGVRGMAAAC